MNKITYILLFATLFFAACSADDIPNGVDKDKQIELRLTINGFEGESVTRSGFDATAEENQIENLCLFIESGSNFYKYYIADATADATFTGGSWNKAESKILLGLTTADVTTSDNVYIVANAGDITGSITSVADLQNHKIGTPIPWSDNIKTPLIMSGSVAGHNFTTTPILNAVSLYRAVAKVEFEVTLSEQYQSTPTVTNPYTSEVIDQYKYQLLNFDKQTYLLKPTAKPNDLTYSAWEKWNAAFGDKLSAYTLTSDKVTKLSFVTYLNERDSGNETTLMLQLPFWDAGMPPPQFLEEGYPVKLPTVIERNHYYKVAVSL